MKLFHALAVFLVGVVLSLSPHPVLAREPAVSTLNGKVEILAGEVDGEGTDVLAGSLAAPLGTRLGLQLDTAYGEVGSDYQLKGVGLHLFTRDPEKFLLGIHLSHAELEDIDLNRFALEGEVYGGRVAVATLLGYRVGDVDSAPFVTLDLRWYPEEDLALEAGVSGVWGDDFRMRFGAEYGMLSGLSLFADLAVGEQDYDHILIGARYYFGDRKSLLHRHREDDPVNPVPGGIFQNLGSIEATRSDLGPG